VTPERALLLNVMRDQLDRFGEIDTTAGLLAKVAAATTEAVVLNRDDERIAALAERTRARVSYYGVSAELRPLFPNDEELYGGPITTSTQPAAVELRELPAAGRPEARYAFGSDERAVVIRAEGPHNAQNAAGAAALALTLGLTVDEVVAGLGEVAPAFGRGQSFTVDGRTAIVIAINDDYADGRDVSWLWDVDFTGLAALPSRRSTSGTRAADMAVRLRYDEVGVDEIETDLEKAVRSAVAAVGPAERVVVFSTYTAMWALHAVLQRIGVAA
jgi:UDP-N-acetylmuramyl tripeptide synthase